MAIGSSEAHKQWGSNNFAELAERLARLGHGVIILGGPSEEALARSIVESLPIALHPMVHAITDASVLGSAAALSLCDACIGNDTGMISMAAAVGCPTWVLLGPRPALDHDPLIKSIQSALLSDITVDDVIASFASLPRAGRSSLIAP
jgi:heptosyltransferase-2